MLWGGAWSRGVTSNSFPSTCPGHNGSTRSRCGSVSAMRPPDNPTIINLDEFSAEYTSRAFKLLANCN